MATKKSDHEPVEDGPQKSGQEQVTAPVALRESEWAFHTLKEKDELRYCALWELARLRGSKQKPWLELTDKAKERFMVSEQEVLQEIPATVGPVLSSSLLGRWFGEEYCSRRAITFLVDLSEGEGKLCDAFIRWLRLSQERRKWRKKPKPTRDRWRSLLAKIVIFRATEAGLTREAAIEVTSELWEKWEWGHKWGGKRVESQGILSASHWSRALRGAKTLRQPVPDFLIVDPPFNGGGDVVGPPFYRVLIGRRTVRVGQVKPGAMPAAK